MRETYQSWEAPIITGYDDPTMQKIQADITVNFSNHEEIYAAGHLDENGNIDVAPILSPIFTVDYLYKDFICEPQPNFELNYSIYFSIQAGSGESEHILEYNWTYDESELDNLDQTNRVKILNNPITNVVQYNQLLFPTVLNYTQNEIRGEFDQGQPIIFPDQTVSVCVGTNTWLFGDVTQRWPDLFKDTQYIVTHKCFGWSIYYVNPLGGIDTFPLRSVIQKSFNRKSENIYKEYQSSDSILNKERYLSNITRTITFTTGPITDEQAERMDEIFNSPKIWIHNLQDNSKPVTCEILDGSISIQNYLHNGMKAPQYNFTVQLNNKIIR